MPIMSGEYYHTPESVDEYIKAAEGHSGKVLIEKLRGMLPNGSDLLELGSGPGTDWAILTKYYQVTGSDYSREFVRRLSLKHPNEQFLKLDAADIRLDQKFDAVYSNKVLHHLTDEQLAASVKSQYNILNRGGLICHSFWAGEGSEEFKGMFVNYHNQADLNSLLTGLFEPLLIEPYAEFEEGDSLLLIARKL